MKKTRFFKKDDDKKFESLANATYYCHHCHHSLIINANEEKKICQWCGWYVFKNDKDKFIYRLKENINKKKERGDVSGEPIKYF